MREIPCPECGTPRPITDHNCKRAEIRPCRACFLRALNERQADIDEMAVERLLSGSPVRSTRAERQLAVAYLTERKQPLALIAERLHISRRTAERLRQRSNPTRGGR